jgi:UDP-4-amino-4-deoxy-L-arabinose-oxoglutarate aminotransferase
MIQHSKPWIAEADRRAVDDVLATGMLSQGDRVAEFEAAAAEYLGSSGAVAVGSGTAALTLTLKALDVSAGDQVILPTYVCRNVLEAVFSSGASPVLCDVGDEWNMTAETVAPKISDKTAAIILVHIYGIPADTQAILNLGIPVVEDCAQAFGAQVAGAKVGTSGVIGMFSFHATKCLTTGEGGLAVSSDPILLSKMRALRDGSENLPADRLTSPMTNLQAALGLSQLSRYPQFLDRRQKIADAYFSGLKHCAVELPTAIRGKSIFFRFPLRAQGDFESLRKQFDELGVHVRRGVDRLLHHSLGLDAAGYANAERGFANTVSIPIYPALDDQEVDRVVEACRAVWGDA